jgi:hypothetical protein
MAMPHLGAFVPSRYFAFIYVRVYRNSPKIRRIFDIDSDLFEPEVRVLRLEKTAWTRIFRDLGLSDIRSGKPGPASRKE